MITKQPYKTDIAVLILFFNRPGTLRQVFDCVREARPSKLFLYQDGAREGNAKDAAGVKACREIVADEHIDWECEVHRLYQEKNYGCDPSEYLSQRWAFSMVDKCVVLEDDDVPSQSFFPFCKEMLDRYEHDPRVWMIAGLNIDQETTDCADSYFFTSNFCISGWASWRRVFETWDSHYTFLDDPQTMKTLKAYCKARNVRSDFIKMCYDHRDSGKAYYESIFWSSMILNSGLAIVPRVNMIRNVGLTADATHTASSLATTPRGFRRFFELRPADLPFPLKHPKYIIENTAYKDRYYVTNAWNHPWIKAARSFEELWLNLKAGNFKYISKAATRRVNKWLGRDRHV